MNCERAIELMSGYLDGELDAITNQEIEVHLNDCDKCTQAYEIERDLIKAIAGGRDFSPALSTARRLSRLRDRHVKVLPGHSSRRRLLVHGGHRLDHRPLVHCVRPARAWSDERFVRRRAAISRRSAALANCRAARRQYLSHLTNRHSHVA